MPDAPGGDAEGGLGRSGAGRIGRELKVAFDLFQHKKPQKIMLARFIGVLAVQDITDRPFARLEQDGS